MKRILFLSSISIATFLTGFLLVKAALFFNTESLSPSSKHVEFISVQAPDIADDFKPEFLELPDFEEIEQAPSSSARLIDVREVGGSYRREELPANTGETWLGLFWNNEVLEFRRIKVKVSKEKGQNYGFEDSVTLGFPRTNTPKFLVKGIPSLKVGKVWTLDTAVESVTEPGTSIKDSLAQGFRKEYLLNDQKYVLRVTTGIQIDGGKFNVLVLESNGESQIVTFNHYYKDHNTLYDSIGDLLWVGDMDTDGKLDLYISDYGFEKGGFGSQLFLSSEAKPGDLVRRVATFGTFGC